MSRIVMFVAAMVIVPMHAYAACTIGTSPCNTTFTGRLEANDCQFNDGTYYDVWQFAGTQGQWISIDMTSSAIDSYLIVIDPSNNVVQEVDSNGYADPERYHLMLTSTGNWTIIANSYEPQSGDYSISLGCSVCTPSAIPLTLNNSRYNVTLCAVDPNGSVSQGVPNTQTNLFGWFSLPGFTGNAGNPEVFVKVLGPVNGVPWVFYSGLTNLAYTILVYDRATESYLRPYTKLAVPSGQSHSFGDFDVNGNYSQNCNTVTVTAAQTTPGGSCVNNSTSLCLLGRFAVTMAAKDNPTRTNNTGPGVALPVNTNFGFFTVPSLSNDATNIEAFVKMVDGRQLNNRFWVFLGGLTDFELTVTVTDTTNGRQQIYRKPAASTCGLNDTSAFSP